MVGAEGASSTLPRPPGQKLHIKFEGQDEQSLALIHQAFTGPAICCIAAFVSSLDDLAIGTLSDEAPDLHGRRRTSLFRNSLLR